MFSKHQKTSIALAVSLALAACGSDDENDTDGVSASAPGVSASADASGVRASAPGVSASANGSGASASAGAVDLTTAQLALDELSGSVDTTVTGFAVQNPVPPASGTTPPAAMPARPAIAVTCNAGGTASVGGYVNVVPAPVLVDVKVAIDYAGCSTPNGTAIAGNIDFSQTVAAGAGTPVRVETLYQGEVTLTGRVNAVCAVDLNVLVDELGKTVQVGGTFCGHEASALNVQVQPRWRAD